MKKRLNKILNFLTEKKLDCVIITKPENRRYFSGFTGSSGMLVISKETNHLLTDFRYIEQATEQAELSQVVRYSTTPFEHLNAIVEEYDFRRIGFEGEYVAYDGYGKLSQCHNGVEWISVSLDPLRMIKDELELSSVIKAIQIADKAYSHIVSFIRPGMKEREVALELEYQMRKLGSQKPAFDTIVASGERGALPHGVAADRVINTGDLITLDFGAVYKGYHSDITRTFCVGQASDKQREIYDIVLNAQLAGIEAVRPGLSGKDIDTVARNIIDQAGYGQYFGHGLGHGVGLAIHEDPRLSPSNVNILMQPGMLVTVEPGIYIPGWGGIRIEDIVLVTAVGCQVLTASSKQFIEIM